MIKLDIDVDLYHYLDRVGEGCRFHVSLEIDDSKLEEDLPPGSVKVAKVFTTESTKRYLNQFHPECSLHWENKIKEDFESGKQTEMIFEHLPE